MKENVHKKVQRMMVMSMIMVNHLMMSVLSGGSGFRVRAGHSLVMIAIVTIS